MDNIFEAYLKLVINYFKFLGLYQSGEKDGCIRQESMTLFWQILSKLDWSYFVESDILNIIVYVLFSREVQIYSFGKEKVLYSPFSFSF